MSSIQIEKIRFENLTFAHEGQEPLFENVHFDFPMNDLVWIKAGHGEGRSALLQLLAVLTTPQRGSYFINDLNTSEMTFEEFLPYRLAIGYGFDTGGLIHNRTVFENLALPLNYHHVMGGKQVKERVLGYLEQFGIMKYKDMRPSIIPGWARKIACLIRSIILHPQMLLLDDPSVGVPQETSLTFFDVLQGLRKEGTLKHIFINSFDDQLMNLMDHTEIFIEEKVLYGLMPLEEKKVVNL